MTSSVCVLFVFLSSLHKCADKMAQARSLSHTHTHTHTLPPLVCVGFLQTYLYGICILQTFIWLSGLGPRGAGVAWGSVSQTHTDGWARGACATLYWVSYDYPALSLSHTHTYTHTHTAERDCQRDREKEWDGWRKGKTDEGRKKWKEEGSERTSEGKGRRQGAAMGGVRVRLKMEEKEEDVDVWWGDEGTEGGRHWRKWVGWWGRERKSGNGWDKVIGIEGVGREGGRWCEWWKEMMDTEEERKEAEKIKMDDGGVAWDECSYEKQK